MNSELSTLGTLIFSGFGGENEISYFIIIENFIETDENIASFYSITGKYLPGFEYLWFYVESEISTLKSQLNKII